LRILRIMRLSSLAPALLVALAIVPVIAVAACDSGSTSQGTPLPDADVPSSPDTGPSVVDATLPDTSAPIPDAADDAVDAADAADSAVATSNPFATGLDATGTPMADGTVDTHWSVKDGAGTVLTSYVHTDALGYPGYWMAPSATSKFISPFVDTVDPSGNGTFTYTTTFGLGPEVNLAGVQLVIRYASDNQMVGITLNGQTVAGVTAGSYSAFTSVTVTSSFVTGTNTVSFTVGNAGGPTGLRAELDLTR